MSDLRARIEHANGLVSVYDLIEYVADRSRPRKIHCPVHDDRTKSAVVYPDTNQVYCFTCSRTYDPVALVSELEGLSIPAACGYIERNAGVRWEAIGAESPLAKFHEYIDKAKADPDDFTRWSRRETILYRWAVHRTVLEAGLAEVDWDGFDDAHLDVAALREWRDKQLANSPSIC